MTIQIPADALTDFCAEIFACVGCRSEEARRVSASLVEANLTGHDSHSVIRVPRYPVTPSRPPRSVARGAWKTSFPD
jgi:hydroxycarboxylate dehydrogenase B